MVELKSLRYKGGSMKSYCIKMFAIVLIVNSIILIFKEKNKEDIIVENVVVNNLIYRSDVPYNQYQEEKVYEGLTLEELGAKIDNVFHSTLSGYGTTVASLALEKGVDPVVASSIILVETGCKWTCSSLVKNNNNVGGMLGKNGYAKFASLEVGIEAFINNLANNYYKKGLNTPELINKKYATNPNWYKNVYYYVDLIKAS